MANTQTLNYNQILVALRQKREQIEQAILIIERLAEGEDTGRVSVPGSTRKQPSRDNLPAKKHRISAAGRKRIAEASRKRWAAKRAADAAAAKGSGTSSKRT